MIKNHSLGVVDISHLYRPLRTVLVLAIFSSLTIISLAGASAQQHPNFSAFVSAFASNRMEVAWNSMGGVVYQLQIKTNITDPTWLSILGDITATNTTSLKAHSFGAAMQQFFRVTGIGGGSIGPIVYSYYASDFYPISTGRTNFYERGFDEALIKFVQPTTNNVFVTPSGVTLKFRRDILEEGQWWQVIDGISSGDRRLDLTNLVEVLNADTNIAYAFPIYHHPPSGAIAFGGERLLVDIAAGKSFASISDLAEKYNLELVGTLGPSHIVRRRNPKVGAAFQIAAELRTDSRISNAIPYLAILAPER